MKKDIWTLSRSLLFIVIGLLNTAFIRPEEIGNWKNYLGFAFLIVAAIDLTFLLIKVIMRRKEISNQ